MRRSAHIPRRLQVEVGSAVGIQSSGCHFSSHVRRTMMFSSWSQLPSASHPSNTALGQKYEVLQKDYLAHSHSDRHHDHSAHGDDFTRTLELREMDRPEVSHAHKICDCYRFLLVHVADTFCRQHKKKYFLHERACIDSDSSSTHGERKGTRVRFSGQTSLR